MTSRRLRLVRLLAVLAGAACADSAGPSDVLVVSSVSISPSGGSLIVGQTLQLTATARTSSGITVPGRAVTWSSANATVASVSSAGLVTGVAIGGPVTITATIDGRNGVISVTITPIPVSTVTIDPPQSAILVGGAVQLTATVRGDAGQILPGRPVEWNSAAPGTATVTTQGMVVGIAAGGPVSITATSEGKAGSAQVTVGARPASRLGFLTNPPNGIAGQALAPAVRVAVQDDIGNTVAGATTSISLTLNSNPGGAVLGGATIVNAVNGVATFPTLVLDKSAAGYVLGAAAIALSPTISNPFNIASAAAAAITITTQPSTAATSGAVLARQPVVQLRDGLGNPATQAGVTITATLASGPGTLGGTVAVVSNASGVVSFTNLSITGPSGPHTIRFAGTGLTAVVSDVVTLGAGAATQLAIVTQPSAAGQSGVALPIQPVIALRDGSGNPVTQAGVAVSVTVSAPGVLGGIATVITDGTGRASFAGVSITGTASGYTLSFTSTGLTGVTSTPITLTAGTATRLAMVTQPSATATVAVVLAQQPAVRLLDGTGNQVLQAGVTVTVILGSGAGALGGTATAVTNASGIATFTGLVITGFVGPYTLNFAAPGLLAVVSDPILLGTGPANSVTIATQPSGSATSGVAFPQQPVIQVVDIGGNPVSQAGVTVTAVLASGAGALGGTLTALTNGSGRATFTNLAITGGAGTYTIGFSAPGLGAVTSGIIGLGAGVATQLTITTQPSAAAQSGVTFGTQPVIQLRDASNNVVAQAGVTVTATITAPGTGTLGITMAVATNAGGVATFTDLRITGLVGDRTLTFTATGLAPAVSGTITLSAGLAARLAMVTQPSATVANTVAFPQQPAVRLEDAAGNPVATAGTVVTVAIATGGVTLGGTLTASTVAGGIATFTNLGITGLIGVRTLSFSTGALTPATSAGVTITPGIQTQLAITTQPSASAQSAVVFAQQPVVQLRDVSGNNVSLAGISVAAAITAPGTGTLGGTLGVVTNGAGQAGFTNLMITGSAGARTLQFTSGVLTPVTSTAVTLTAGSATQMTITTQPSAAAQSGAVLAVQPVIQLRDVSNNPVAEAGRIVTAVIGVGSPVGTLGGTVTATTNASGVATFTNLVITGTVGNFTLRFDEPGLPSVTSNTVVLSAGTATRLGITAQPSPTASSGVGFVQQPIIQILDAAGNNVAQAATAVTASIATGAGATLGGATVVVTDGTGRATFATLALTGTSGPFTLRFAAASLTDTVSTTIGLGAGAGSKLSITTQPSASVVNGVDLPTQPVIQLRDAADNPVAQGGTVVSVTILSGAGALSGTTTATTNASGVASFTNLRLTGLIGDRTLIFAAAAFVSITSGTVTVTPGTPTALSLTTAPSAAARSSLALSQQPVLQLRDQSGNAVSEAGRPVTASIASGAAAISGGTSVLTDGAGQATFVTLSITGLIGIRTVGFGSAGLLGVTSGNVTLSAGPATQLSITTQPGATSAVSGAPVDAQPVVRLLDGAGNPVDSAGASVAAVVASGAAVLSGTTPVTTNASGIATFTNLVLTGTAGPHTLRFDATSLTSATSGAFTVTAGAAIQVTITTAPAAAAQSGIALTTQPAIQLRDGSSNPVGQAGVTVTATVASGPGGSSLASATAMTNGAGLATFASLAITGTVGTYTLTFTGTGIAGTATSGNIVLGAGLATTLTITTQPSATARSSLALAQVPVVTVRDAALNPVAGTTVTAALVGSGALGGTTSGPSDAAGQITFTGLTITGAAGNKTLDFSAPALTTVSSGTIALSAGPATKLGITTQPSGSVVNDAVFPVQPVVRLLDSADNPLDSAGATISATITAPGTGILGGTLNALTVGGTGAATFTDLKLTGLIGDRTLTFSATGLTSVVSGTVTVTPGAATQLVMVQQPPATIGNGAVIAPNPSVRLRDISGNNVLTALTSVTVALGSGGPTLGGTQSQNTDASGIATFTDLTITGALGARTLAFTSGALTGVTSSSVTTTAGAATKLTITTAPPGTAQSGIALTTPPTIQLRDASDNPVSTALVTVNAVIASSDGGGTPTLSNASAATDGTGLASFSTLAINGLVGNYTIRFESGALATVTSGTIVLSAGPAPTQVTIATQPGGGRSTIALGTQPTVQLRDGSSNPVAQAGVVVTATIATSPGGSPTVSPAGATATTDVTGLATFNGLKLNGLVGNYTLTFTGTGVAGTATSGNVALTAGPATQLSLTTQPGATSAVNGAALNAQPVVQLRDSVGNVVDSAGATVTAARLGGTATLTGTTGAVTNASGVATFTDLVLTGIAGAHTLQFTAAPLTPVTSASFNLTPGAATAVVILTQTPAAATNAVTLTQSPIVEVRDVSTNLITGTSVTVALATGAGTGTLNGTLSINTNGSGQATFADLNIVGTIGTYSMQFTAGTGSATSNDITLSAGTATALAITTQPEATPAAGVAFVPQPVVRLIDSGGNTVTTDGIVITAERLGDAGTLGGTLTANTVTGVATWTNLSLTPAGSFTIRFTSPGLTSVTSAAVVVP